MGWNHYQNTHCLWTSLARNFLVMSHLADKNFLANILFCLKVLFPLANFPALFLGAVDNDSWAQLSKCCPSPDSWLGSVTGHICVIKRLHFDKRNLELPTIFQALPPRALQRHCFGVYELLLFTYGRDNGPIYKGGFVLFSSDFIAVLFSHFSWPCAFLFFFGITKCLLQLFYPRCCTFTGLYICFCLFFKI